jgi:hypothetical protein
MKKQILGGAILLIALAGCASNQHPDKVALDADLKASKVVVQVCVPAAGDLGHVIVRGITPYSETGGRIDKTGYTTANQPIFETFTESPADLKAVTVSFGDLSYSYLANSIPSAPGTWSDWKLPDFVTAEALNQFLNGRGPAPESIPSNSAKLRFSVMPFGEYLDRSGRRSKRGQEFSVPSC